MSRSPSVHRHLDPDDFGAEQLGLAALDDLLGRPDLPDAAEVVRAIRRDPFGRLAERVLTLGDHRADAVGLLWIRLVARARAELEPVERLSLAQLRCATGLRQAELAEALHTGQSDISKLERRRDVKLSTLRALVAANGGELEVHVRWPDGHRAILDLDLPAPG